MNAPVTRAQFLPVLVAVFLPMFLYATLIQAAYAQAEPASVRACAACHGARGEGGTTGAPRLAGQSPAYLAQQLAAYADGRRQHPVMTPIARALPPEEREALAAYYAGLPLPTPPPQVGEGRVAPGKKKA